jgi:hypothetical protein
MEKLKNIYKQMRLQNQYPINFFYSYFIAKGGTDIGLQNFGIAFNHLELDPIIQMMDSEFKLTFLINNKNQIIKIL